MVIFGPIRQVGCWSASAGVTLASSRRQIAEGAARGRQHQALDALGRLLALQALPDGAVLAVDRQQRRAERCGRLDDQVAGHDQGFFVGERHRLAGLQGGECRAEADRAAGGDDHHVHVGLGRHVDERGRRRQRWSGSVERAA